MTIDKIKRELTAPIFDHISGLNREQLEKQRESLLRDMELIGRFHGLYRIREIELRYINYKLS
jgi:hypothetical protein